ncbi:DUF305 domain-containing protein [Nocardioides aurantiacus]|uniref:Uncharacterized protein (DUF305 family) n=1 Tax=Nocardioides aurantiacus TaxID=86796 RepID=A0A3N2CWC8_9ACTN|nr:DUF305 domain-containing protein [Nocardioides aurantiacus]ROR91840.1 uncharacterized protein (DUF305 family) [Nocardioides aurantiacus]
MKRLFSALALTLIAVLTLAACGSGSSGGSSSSDFNDADVTFVQDMIPHHKQAVQMSKMAATNASAPEVKDLAKEIDAAQGPEIETMQGWLKDWDKSQGGSMGGMGEGGMSGMMSGGEMKSLRAAKGAAFDQMFLNMMIAHHTGAIEMAQAEQKDGKNADAKALAEDIEQAQTDEIALMNKILDS